MVGPFAGLYTGIHQCHYYILHILLFQKREVEYDKYQMDKIIMAKNDFRSLLKETKLITYKSRDLVRDSERHYKDILELLKVIRIH